MREDMREPERYLDLDTPSVVAACFAFATVGHRVENRVKPKFAFAGVPAQSELFSYINDTVQFLEELPP